MDLEDREVINVIWSILSRDIISGVGVEVGEGIGVVVFVETGVKLSGIVGGSVEV
jgi:hypothetical protein